MQTKNKGGRPPNPNKIERPEAILVRLTADEKRAIDEAAKDHHVSTVEWCRRLLMSQSMAGVQ